MGRGDRKTTKGKISMGSHGKKRPKRRIRVKMKKQNQKTD